MAADRATPTVSGSTLDAALNALRAMTRGPKGNRPDYIGTLSTEHATALVELIDRVTPFYEQLERVADTHVALAACDSEMARAVMSAAEDNECLPQQWEVRDALVAKADDAIDAAIAYVEERRRLGTPRQTMNCEPPGSPAPAAPRLTAGQVEGIRANAQTPHEYTDRVTISRLCDTIAAQAEEIEVRDRLLASRGEASRQFFLDVARATGISETLSVAQFLRRLAAQAEQTAALRQSVEQRDEQIRDLRFAGGLLANCAFNLSQSAYPVDWERSRRTLSDCRVAWDGVVEKHVAAREVTHG